SPWTSTAIPVRAPVSLWLIGWTPQARPRDEMQPLRNQSRRAHEHILLYQRDRENVLKGMRFLPGNFLCDKSGKLLEGYRPGCVIGPDHGDILFFYCITQECQGIPSGGLLSV